MNMTIDLWGLRLVMCRLIVLRSSVREFFFLLRVFFFVLCLFSVFFVLRVFCFSLENDATHAKHAQACFFCSAFFV